MVDKQMVLFVLVEVARLREINVTLYDTYARSFPIRDNIQLREIGNWKSPNSAGGLNAEFPRNA